MYYDIWVRPNSYRIGDWVYYFNPRKFAGRQDKWKRKYSGPFLVVDVPSSVTVRIQRGKTAKPFTVHVDKVKPYVSDYMPKSWVTNESAVSESERPAVEQSNEFESSTERLESPTKQGPTEQRSLEPEISAEFDISSETELKTPLRDTQRKARVESGYEVDCPPLARPKRTSRPPAYLKDYACLHTVRYNWYRN